jgi:hypothetical protein
MTLYSLVRVHCRIAGKYCLSVQCRSATSYGTQIICYGRSASIGVWKETGHGN